MDRTRTARLVTSALVAALLAASAYVTVPLQPVPLTFQVFVVVLAALVLPPGGALAAVGVYLLLGAVGMPVFAGMKGGAGVLVGPTGGYLWGFLAGATLGALARETLRRAGLAHAACDAVAAALVIVVAYALGAAQLAVVMHLGPEAALLGGVVPFIGIDAAKAVAAVAVAAALRKAGVPSTALGRA